MHQRTRTRVIAATVVILAILTVCGFTLRKGPDSTRPQPADTSPAAPHTPTTLAEPTGPPGVPTSGPEATRQPAPDADAHARAVAEQLLTWDTNLGPAAMDQMQPLLLTTDPTGQEPPALISDIGAYLPDDTTWQLLRRHATRQTVTIHDAVVPTTWPDILTSDAAYTLQPGTTAVTIRATRHRTGTWLNQPASSDHPIRFTIFMACPTTPCHTLRISRPDEPLR